MNIHSQPVADSKNTSSGKGRKIINKKQQGQIQEGGEYCPCFWELKYVNEGDNIKDTHVVCEMGIITDFKISLMKSYLQYDNNIHNR